MNNLLYDVLLRPHQDKTSPFVTTISGEVTSYGEFVKMTARIANALVSLGLTKGDRVAVQVEKSVEAIAIFTACGQSGLVFLPLNTAYTAAELKYFLEDSGAKLFICDNSKQTALEPIAKAAGAAIEVLNADGSGSLTELTNQQSSTFETVHVRDDELVALLYTSGTTGRSKGAMLTQQNLLSNAVALARHWQFNDQDVLLHALPIFHTHGLFVAINTCLISGASILMMPSFNLNTIIEKIPDSTVLMGVPTFYTRLLSDKRFNKRLTNSMRLFISGSAPLLADTHIQFEQRTGHRILERYGMTETNMNTSNPYEGERRAGTVGFPLPGVELKITHVESGETLPKGETGMLEVRGPNVFKGYWNMPEKTKEELRDDGFFITGDLAMIDQDGYVKIIGRDKDLIISGGFNVYPKEIEVLLDEQEGVLESAVIGIPHPDFGETPMAIIVPLEDQEADIAAINEVIKGSLARYKHPSKLIIIDELPRNTMGKVQKNLLREKYK